MPLTSHLEELRKRLIYCVIAYLAGVVACFVYAKQMFELLKAPLSHLMSKYPGSTFAIRSLAEGFMVDLKVAAIAGAIAASPVFIYHIWKFVAPGLYTHERKLIAPIIISSSLLFITGALFGYLVIFPASFDFFLSYTSPDTAAILSIDDYLGFAAKLLVGFGLVFETPLVIFILARLGIVNHTQLRQVRRYVIVGSFVLAAIITPPDVVSQIGVAIPLVLLYEVGIVLAWMVGKKRRTDAEVLEEKALKQVGR